MKLSNLTRLKLLDAELKAERKCIDCIDRLIEAGRGLERISETRTKSDPLSVRYCKVLDLCRSIQDEKQARIKHHGGLSRVFKKEKGK